MVEADAAEYRFPDNDMVVYLYNPFSKEVMEKVLENLRESLGKRLYVIYKVPDCAEIFDKSGFLIRMGGPPTRPYIQIWKAASSIPSSTLARPSTSIRLPLNCYWNSVWRDCQEHAPCASDLSVRREAE